MNNSKGITLLEVLLTLTIFFLISIIGYTVLQHTFQQKETISKRINLSQEANLLIRTIEQYHYNEDSYSFKFENDKAYIGTNENWVLLNPENINLTLTINGHHTGIYSIDTSKQKQLMIHLTLSTQGSTNQKYSISTTIKRL